MLISTRDIQVILSKKIILNQISYQFYQGKIYGIIGPNGAGKSTYLKVISGFTKPTSGKIYFQGKQLHAPNRNIAVVWQKPYLFQTSVYHNIAYGLKIRGMKRESIKKKVAGILELFQIKHLEDQKAESLSGGEAAKVAIARAVVTSPDLLILDEPTASLDPKSVLDIEKIIADLKVRFNMTIIIVTHNMFQAKRLADETLFFDSGELIEVQSTEGLFDNPLHPMTMKFISGESFYG